MAKAKTINSFLESEMDRRKFLGMLGASALVVTGITGILDGLQHINNKQVFRGYGSSSYGGGNSTGRKA